MISMLNFLHLLNSTKPKLPAIKCPFLIMQTKDDDTTRLKIAYYIYNNIKSEDKSINFYDKGGQLVLVGNYKDKVIMDIEEFIRGINDD